MDVFQNEFDVPIIDVWGMAETSPLVGAKDVITSGGEWISSVELENYIMGHLDVVEAAVVGVPDERWQERSLAAVLLKENAGVTALELRDCLRDKVVRWWLPEGRSSTRCRARSSARSAKR
jgi:acyl-CoA synthetase (AMP-forming)/AMP-acid ligase II